MKLKLVLLAAILVQVVAAGEYQYGKYVYFNPSLTADSAPHSYYTKDRVKRKRTRRATRRRRVVPTMKRRVVYQPVEYVYYEPQTYREPKICTTRNNIVKEINRGAPRRVVNGTYRVCDEAVSNRYKSENFQWRWTHSNPAYSKTPVYVEDQPHVSRYGKRFNKYQTIRHNADREYYYR
ncbi:MAG: hypothetical protein KC646_10635 [Candidatus Cloacimonetes bacterium]|nr:hypothetical protein [Candidatus Cloacimonadota bacterium]